MPYENLHKIIKQMEKAGVFGRVGKEKLLKLNELYKQNVSSS